MLPYELIEKVKEKNPLIHNITNIVVANDSANGLLAIGASPFMSSSLEEMEEVATIADSVVLNMGTLNDEQLTAMIAVGKKANALNKPVVLDPVGAGATTYRKKAVTKLLGQVCPTLIRGNAGEIAALAGVDWSAKGVDAGSGAGNKVEIAKKLAIKASCLVAISGETDIVTDGKRVYLIGNGSPFFSKMTGAGCLSSCVCGAFLAVGVAQPLEAIVVGSLMYALAGELVANKLQTLAVGSFRTLLLDQLSNMTPNLVREQAKLSEEK